MNTPARDCALANRVLPWIGLLTAGALVLATIMAVAPASGQTAPPGGGSGLPPQTSLAHAVRVAEQQTGGRARKAEMERTRSTDVYEIKTVAKRNPPTSSSILSGGVSWLDAPFTREAQGSRGSP